VEAPIRAVCDSAYASRVSDAPIELIARDDPYPGLISARRRGEPSFSHVQDIGDAYIAAQLRGVHIVMSEQLVSELRATGDLPPELPAWIEIRNDV